MYEKISTEQPTEQEKLPSIEDLHNIIPELENEIELLKQQKESDIKNKLEEREEIIAEDVKTTELLKEAGKILEFYEEQQKCGFLMDEKDIAKLEEVRDLYNSLSKQREILSKKYDTIMDNPDLYDRVLGSANKENKEIDEMKKRQEAESMLEEVANDFCQKLIQTPKEEELFRGEYKNRWEMIHKNHYEIQEIWSKFGANKGDLGFNSPSELKSYDEFIEKIEEYKKSLGILKRKQRSSIAQLLKHKDKFITFYQNKEEGEDLNKRLSDVYNYTELKEEYKNIMYEAWEHEYKIQEEFPGEVPYSSTLPEVLYSKIRNILRQRNTQEWPKKYEEKLVSIINDVVSTPSIYSSDPRKEK